MNNKISYKKLSNWDLIFYRITLRYIHFYFSTVIAQILVLYVIKPDHIPLVTQGYLAFTVILGLIIFTLSSFLFGNLFGRIPLCDFTYAFKNGTSQFRMKFPEYNNRLKPFYIKLLIAFADIVLLINVALILPAINYLYRILLNGENLSFFSSLYRNSLSDIADRRIYILVFLQMCQIIFFIFLNYRNTAILNNLGFKEMVEEKYNSEEAKKYPAYSRFWLYAFPIAVLLLWIFIHPLSLLLIKALH